MDLVNEPPGRLLTGKKMSVPLVVVIRQIAGREIETSGLWMFVSLLIEHAGQYWTVQDDEILRGRRVDSIHPVPRNQEQHRDCIGFSSFPDLAILRPGRYRLRIDLIDMNRAQDYASTGGLVMPAIATPAFNVVSSEEHPPYEQSMTVTVDRLEYTGITV